MGRQGDDPCSCCLCAIFAVLEAVHQRNEFAIVLVAVFGRIHSESEAGGDTLHLRGVGFDDRLLNQRANSITPPCSLFYNVFFCNLPAGRQDQPNNRDKRSKKATNRPS